jgi:hypothetical protein
MQLSCIYKKAGDAHSTLDQKQERIVKKNTPDQDDKIELNRGLITQEMWIAQFFQSG